MLARGVGTAAAVGALLVLALIACGPAPSSPTAPSQGNETSVLQSLIDGARKEGKLSLVWTEGTIGGSEAIQRWAEGFNRLYGLNLDVQFTPGPPMAPMAARIVQEYQANRPASTDVYLSGANDLIPTLEANALEAVNWASWAPNIQNPELVAVDGALVEIAAPMVGIVYNSNKFTADTAPKSLQDLLRPQYKGRIASTSYAALFDRLASPELWGEQRIIEYMTQFSSQLGGLIGCSDYERIVSGEFDILAIACNLGQARTWQARGAPVAYVIPSDAAMVQYWYMGIPRTAAHPNAAKLWLNYMLSREAQDILYAASSLDHYLIEGSQFASEIKKTEAAGTQIHHVGIEFIQRNDIRKIREVSAQLQRMVQQKQ
jgi:ABC-type Fe3+ transport system substrate-binding protein